MSSVPKYFFLLQIRVHPPLPPPLLTVVIGFILQRMKSSQLSHNPRH